MRRVKPGLFWHPAKDNLMGTDVYGKFVNRPTAKSTFSVKFSHMDFDEFLFATGDMQVTEPNILSDSLWNHEASAEMDGGEERRGL